MLAVLLASLLGTAAASAELPWTRVAPGVAADGCDPAPGSRDRLYWLRDGQRLPQPPDRLWEPGAYLCVREGNHSVSLQRALLVAEEEDGGDDDGACFAGGGEQRRLRRVADGVRARDAPWVAQLLLAGRFACGCSLVAQRWALTAAHCLPEGNGTALLAVLLGPTRLNGPRVGVLRALPHPGYARGTASREHDIALLFLERWRGRLAAACLPPAAGYLERFSQGVLFGWGRVGPRGGPALRLQEAALPITSRERCEQAVQHVAPTAFCAGFGEAYRADACEGDSGGPLAGFVDDRPVVLGVVSWGHACARPFTFGVYTRVDSYLPWIRAHVQGGGARTVSQEAQVDGAGN